MIELEERILGVMGDQWLLTAQVCQLLEVRELVERRKVARHLKSMVRFGYLEETTVQFGWKCYYAYRRKG